MDVRLQIHVEPSDGGGPVWWAESPELPGFTASADSLLELRTVIRDVFAELGVGEIHIVAESLVATPGEGVVTDGRHAPDELTSEGLSRSPIQVTVPA